jgi:hypothetical protein
MDHPTSPESVQELGAVREPNQVGPSIRDPTRVFDSVERLVLVSTCRSRTRSLHKILETRSGSKLVGTHLCLFHLEGLGPSSPERLAGLLENPWHKNLDASLEVARSGT